jgi:ABC-type multidrug transport system fused ATPase/permease subunit
VVIDRGRIVEEGHHEDLLQREGVYARLYHGQFRTPVSNPELRETFT